MSAIAAVLWVWLAVSIGVYGYRLYRRVSKGSPTAAKAAEQANGVNDDPNRPLGAASALIQNPVAGFEPPSASPAADAPASPVPPVDLTPPATPTVTPPVPPAGLIPPAPGPADPALQPVWTAAAPGELPASERRTPRQPIAEAVAGIRLPCDLAPLVGEVTRIDPFDVSFFTTTHDGDSVRGALAGELVGLGFQVATTSTYRLVASRPDAEVVVTIYPDPAAATEGGRALFPTAIPDAVVVRLQS